MNLNIPHWQVWDPLWNQSPAWPKEEFPDATLFYMREAGCLVTSLATLLLLYGMETRTDIDQFSPWILNEKLKKIGAFSSSADLELTAVQDLYPLHYIGSIPYSREALSQCFESGEMCIIEVNGSHDVYHYVVPTSVTVDDVYIIDSGWDNEKLSAFAHIYSICRFEKSTVKTPDGITAGRPDHCMEDPFYCVPDVPHIEQCPEWPTGCECVSTVMLLNYLGCRISVDEFIPYLPKGSVTEENGVLYGDDPNRFFIGSPYDEDSFGCYAGTIIRALNRFIEENRLELKVKDVSSLSTKQLIQNYIHRDLPVIYWATIGMLPSFEGDSWKLRWNDSVFTWTAQEHCMLLKGEDAGHYLFSDPWYPDEFRAYPKELTEKRHTELYSMAVTIERISKDQGAGIHG